MAELFGFVFKRKDKEENRPSFVSKQTDDGAMSITTAGRSYGTYVDLDGTVRSEAEMVTKYRQMALNPECDSAVDEIVNESISYDEDNIVDVNLDDINLYDNIKKIIRQEFKNCLNILEFNKYSYDIYRRWYIDGRLYYHVIIDKTKPNEGIKELRYIDPRKIRKVREVQKTPTKTNNNAYDAFVAKTMKEYYIYNDRGFNFNDKVVGPATTGLKVSPDSIIHTVSGLTDTNGSMVLSYLHKAIKPLNQLSTLEDATVIYRISRAPERRIWYIDVGNLPKMKAEQYVREIMVKHKNRLIYDAASGEVRDDRKFMTMLEDYWLPRREGGRGTEVTTLPGGQNLGEMEDVLYFQKKFLQALNVPVDRLAPETAFSVGRATQITRDEVKFGKFIIRLRSRFSHLFLTLLEKQLILKGILTVDEWNSLSPLIKFRFAKDNYFTELKNAEIIQNRLSVADSFQNYAGKYYSHYYIRKNVLRQSEEDIKEQDAYINQEGKLQDPRWVNPLIVQNKQALQQQDQSQEQPTDDKFSHLDDTEKNKAQDRLQKVRQAQILVKQLESKKGNRSMQDEAKYKSALQVVAKNKDYLRKMGIVID